MRGVVRAARHAESRASWAVWREDGTLHFAFYNLCRHARWWMRLDDCDLDGIDFVSAAPLTRNTPESEWVSAAHDGAIPSGLFDLYQRANFLSFGTAPRFLSDGENLLFSYFGLVLRSIQESLVDAHEQADLFAAAEELVYDPMKKLRGERWEKDAGKRSRRHFRDLLIALQTTLDALADVIAIFFPGCIARLE